MRAHLLFSRPCSGVAALIFCCVFRAADAEPVIGQFELKTLDSEPGSLEFQSQNAWSWGHPSRRVQGDDTDGLAFDDNEIIRQRHALELEAGLTRHLKTRVGVEFEKERFDDPETLEQANSFDDLQLTEIGVELIAILVPRRERGASLGWVAEYERPVDRDESDKLILGPVFEYQSDRWLFATTPTVVRTFGGADDDESDDKWDFMYATQLAYSLSESWLLSLEAYGTVEQLENNEGDFDQHRAGAVFYYTVDFGSSVTVGMGLLEGLNDHTSDHTLKLSVEVDF